MKKFFKTLLIMFVVLAVPAGFVAKHYYDIIFAPAVHITDTAYFYVPTGSTYADVAGKIVDGGFVSDIAAFEWVAARKKYSEKVKPGRYKLRNGMSNNELVNMLRAGLQETVTVTFNNIRTKEQLAGRICRNIEADSLQMLALLNDAEVLNKYGFKPLNVLAMFVPDSYQFYWNTSAEQVLERMAKEYKRFWTDERKAKAKAIGLTQTEVAVLASIVQAEQASHNDEKPTIAGLYINRLKQGIRLESDPTLVYALGDFTIRRVLNVHKEIDSPYNTYKYGGLPPAPINLPAASSLDAVLNYERHSYIFMCAKEDFSGYHNFAKNYTQHLIYARRYQTELNRRGIR